MRDMWQVSIGVDHLKDPKTTLVGLVLLACGAFLVIQSRQVTADALAILTAGAGFVAASDAKKSA